MAVSEVLREALGAYSIRSVEASLGLADGTLRKFIAGSRGLELKVLDAVTEALNLTLVEEWDWKDLLDSDVAADDWEEHWGECKQNAAEEASTEFDEEWTQYCDQHCTHPAGSDEAKEWAEEYYQDFSREWWDNWERVFVDENYKEVCEEWEQGFRERMEAISYMRISG